MSEQPTDRMLIDALCICMADLYGLTNRDEGANAAIYNKARDIIGAYTPMAHFGRILREQQDLRDVESPELTDDQLSRLRPARPIVKFTGDSRATRVGRLEIGTSRVRIEMEPSIDGASWRGIVAVQLEERQGDPNHGLSDEEVKFVEVLESAHRDDQTITLEMDGRRWTGVRIVEMSKTA